jgi:uncharacterized protein YcfJ
MRKLIFAAAACLVATACQTPQQSAGTATGVVAGAVVGGPVGAVVGGVAGAAVTAPGGPLSPGYCYVQNRRGQLVYSRSGQPLKKTEIGVLFIEIALLSVDPGSSLAVA